MMPSQTSHSLPDGVHLINIALLAWHIPQAPAASHRQLSNAWFEGLRGDVLAAAIAKGSRQIL